jgi:signal transduction histidine kinase
MLNLLEEELRPSGARSTVEGVGAVTAAHILDEVRVRMEDLALARGVRLLVRAGTGDICADARALVEGLGNLVKNAIESSHAGSAVVITSEQGGDGGQLFTVKDTGGGIPEQQLRQLGTPFHSHREGGSGLGIAVARDVVERHGGLTHVESALGVGTRVSIWLPPSHPR